MLTGLLVFSTYELENNPVLCTVYNSSIMLRNSCQIKTCFFNTIIR